MNSEIDNFLSSSEDWRVRLSFAGSLFCFLTAVSWATLLWSLVCRYFCVCLLCLLSALTGLSSYHVQNICCVIWGWASFLNLGFVLRQGHMLIAYQMVPSNQWLGLWHPLNSSIHQWHLLCQFSDPCVFSKELVGFFTPFKQMLVWQQNSL